MQSEADDTLPYDARAHETADNITGVRALIANRARSLGITMADLSRAAGRNDAYVQQYINRGVPKRLPEQTRKAIAAALQLNENFLRDPDDGIPSTLHSTPVQKPQRNEGDCY